MNYEFATLKKNVLDRLNEKAFESAKQLKENVTLNLSDKSTLNENETNDLPNIKAAAQYIKKNGIPGLSDVNQFKSKYNVSLAQVMRYMIAPTLDDQNSELETNTL